MLTISGAILYKIFDNAEVDPVIKKQVNDLDIEVIVADAPDEDNPISTIDLISVVERVIYAQKEGYDIATWHGPNAEALVIGIRSGDLKLTD